MNKNRTDYDTKLIHDLFKFSLDVRNVFMVRWCQS